jgi:acetate kinase
LSILVINCGSATLKASLFEVKDGQLGSRLREQNGDLTGSVGDAVEHVLESLRSEGHDPSSLQAVGHRVVHGGLKLRDTMIVTPEVESAIEEAGELAPLHNARQLEAIRELKKRLPEVPQIAAFDTAFHATIPAVAAAYGLPYSYFERGIRRYGFHGLSHQYASQRVAELMKRPLRDLRTIVCHLGNGSSITAVLGGKSIDTSMGLTPMEGVLMGTRAGDIDSGLLLHLMRTEHANADQLEKLLSKESGLKGLSGISHDLREIEPKVDAGDTRARLALDVFCYRVRKYIGAYTVALDGIDAIVFTGGIGEHSKRIRKSIADGLEVLGVELDRKRNEAVKGEAAIHAEDSRVALWVIPAQEEAMIAREALRLLS